MHRTLVLLVVLAWSLPGCRGSTDLTSLGVGANAGWENGPKVGVDASAGKHEVEVAPLFGPGLSNDAPPPVQPSAPPPSAPPESRSAPQAAASGGVSFLWVAVGLVAVGLAAYFLLSRKSAPKAA